jgi:hypothetical protein
MPFFTGVLSSTARPTPFSKVGWGKARKKMSATPRILRTNPIEFNVFASIYFPAFRFFEPTDTMLLEEFH